MDFKRQKAIYMQIADFILENILALKIKQGEKIQSVREMAATVQVNPNTIQRSYNYLQEREIIYNQRGIGFFVSEDALTKTQEIKRKSFVKQELPQMFKMMKLLNMNFDDLQEIYKQNGSASLN